MEITCYAKILYFYFPLGVNSHQLCTLLTADGFSVQEHTLKTILSNLRERITYLMLEEQNKMRKFTGFCQIDESMWLRSRPNKEEWCIAD